MLNDIDLSKYKIAYACTDIMESSELCQEDVMDLAEISPGPEEVVIALIPKERSLSECSGDDWDDCPAECNASGFYKYPEGTIFLKGLLGGELEITEGTDR